jgi:heme-degrading monooxygenase HmoA
MAVMLFMEAPGASLEDYERVNELMGLHGDEDAPAGLIHHTAGHDGDGIVIVDVWESEEAIGRFFDERLGAALGEVGVEVKGGKPTILPVHNGFEGAGTEPGVILVMDMPNMSADDYDAMTAQMPAHQRDGSGHASVSHTVARKEDGGLLVVDVWDSPDSFFAFAQEQMGDAPAEIGPIEPRVVPVHNRMKGKATQPAG